MAEAVASGGTDVGPGILAVALALGLDFIPAELEALGGYDSLSAGTVVAELDA